jgi:membrane protease YdiL (CAAX protease family)
LRYFHIGLFTAIYIALGFLLHLEAEGYLLIGIPLTYVFQVYVAKKPIHTLWLRDAEKFRLTNTAILISVGFALYPLYRVILSIIRQQFSAIHFGYNCAALAGAFCAGYCYSHLTKKTAKDFFLCLAILLLLRVSLNFVPFIAGREAWHFDVIQSVKSLLVYIPVAFVVEEVVFRGMLDSYIEPAGRPRNYLSAWLVSALWGLWHWPLLISHHWTAALGAAMLSVWGIVLSVFWRRSGNLAVPAFSHAFADAIRDAVK